jgi:hypothetical protein
MSETPFLPVDNIPPTHPSVDTSRSIEPPRTTDANTSVEARGSIRVARKSRIVAVSPRHSMLKEKLDNLLEPSQRPSLLNLHVKGIFNKSETSSFDAALDEEDSLIKWFATHKPKTMSLQGSPLPEEVPEEATPSVAENSVDGQDARCLIIQKTWRRAQTRKVHGPKIKMNRHRNRVIKELLTTERVYNQRLNIMREVAVQPLQWNAKHSQNPILSDAEISSLFSNVIGVLDLSSQLLEKLELTTKLKEQKRPRGSTLSIQKPGVDDIGMHFKAIIPFFKIYIDYCKNFDNSLQLLNEVEKRPLFQTFWSLCQKHPDMLDVGMLNSFLILPVQRIPRCVVFVIIILEYCRACYRIFVMMALSIHTHDSYILLFRDLLKNTWEEHNDREFIQQCLVLLENVGKEVNSKMCIADMSSEMLDAEQAFGGFIEIIQPQRVFYRKVCVSFS